MKKVLLASLIMVALLLGACQAETETGAQTAPTDYVAAASDIEMLDGPTDPEEMEAFFDGVMYSSLGTKNIAGVTVAVVKDGELLFSKGYGYADVANRVEVDPETTMFRVGSVSKLFTWTAVMQLIEQGKIDLDEDIQTYLDFEIPRAYPEPITMRHLLTHSAGFEDRSFALIARSPETQITNGEWLKTHIPAQVRPPGENATYSNYGASLAGYIVERVSGMDYDDYVEQYILEPLDMTHTTSRQPLPTGMEDMLSEGYRWDGAGYAPQEFELYLTGPAGGYSSTGEDIAKFMIAHLQNGRYGDERILQEATAQQMHSRLYTPDERIDMMAYGFMEKDQNGQQIIGHGGDTLFFHNDFNLLLDENVGVFVSCNTAGCTEFPRIAFNAFVDHYYPVKYAYPTPTTDFDQRAELVTGKYRMTRMSYTTMEKVQALLQTNVITVNEDGELLMQGIRFVETEPFIFQRVDGDTKLIFHQADDGTVDYYFINGQTAAFERVATLALPTVNMILLGIISLLFISAIVSGPIVWLARRYGCEKPEQPRMARIARWIAVILSVLYLVFVVLFRVAVLKGDTLVYDDFMMYKVWTVLYVGIVGLALAALGMTIMAWWEGFWRVSARVHYTLITLSAWAFVWFVSYWHLLKI